MRRVQGRSQIDFGSLVEGQAPEEVAGDMGEEVFRQGHQIEEGRVGLIEFHYGEFGLWKEDILVPKFRLISKTRSRPPVIRRLR